MKNIKKILLMIAVLVITITLSSCTTTQIRNTKTPTGNLDLSTVIASSGDYDVTNDVYYSKLRANGYSTVLREIQSTLYAEELSEVLLNINLGDNEVNDFEKELFDSYASDLFQTSDAETIKNLEADELDTLIQKFIDNCSNRGITITKEECLNYKIIDDQIAFTYIPTIIRDEKLVAVASNLASKNALEKIVDNEKITDEDDKLVTNTNYISEDNIISYFNSNTKTYGTYRAIIIQFNNLSEARRAITKVEKSLGALSDDNALQFYISLYNNYYNYRTPISADTPFENEDDSTKTVFSVTKDKDELSEVSASIKNIITTTLDEDYQYIAEPFNQNNQYVMVYRGATEFEINQKYNFTPLNEEVDWEDVKANDTAYNEIKKEIRAQLLDTKIASYVATVLKERVKAADIEIYDPLFEYQFYNTYNDDDYYSLIDPSNFDNNNIFKIVYNNITTNYSVADFYQTQSRESGLNIVVQQLSYDFVYQYVDKFLDSDEIADLEKAVDDAISTFNKNENTAYPTSVGLEVYLLSSFGYTTRDQVVKYNKIASSVLTSYLSQSVFDEWAKLNEDGTYSHEIDYSKLNALDNILAAGNANYENLFSINIDHLLIYIDDNGDGNPDDPKEFIKNFSDEEKAAFNQALLDLSKAIYEEANCEVLTDANDLMDILNYIVGAYTKNEALFSKNDGTTWEAYKKYNFILKVESLSSSGDTTQSNVGNYVTEFGDYIKALYKKAKENNLDVDDDDPIFYFVNSLDKAPSTMEDLCATEFGFHMIVVNDYDSPSSTKSTADSDTTLQFKDFEVLLNELDTDTTDDNIYVIVSNAYNDDTNKATINQLFTYYVETQKSATATLDSSIREVLSAMFSDSITRYTSTNFQNFLLFNELNITAASSQEVLSTQLSNYSEYLRRVSQDYKNDDVFATWYDGSLNWSRPYNK